MKGTGGGLGADKNFAAWEQCDECCVVNYTNQPSNIYLSVIHMWDKDYCFPFVSVKDPLPLDCSINDRLNFDVGFDDVEDSPAINNQSYASASASVIASTPSPSVTSSQREQCIMKALMDPSLARSKSMKMSRRDLFELMTNQVTVVRAVNQVAPALAIQPHKLLGYIIKTRQLMSEYKGEIILLCEKKQAIKLGELDRNAKKRKIPVISREIGDNKKMIAALNQIIEHQHKMLKSITKKGNADNDEEDNSSVISSESGMSDSDE